MSKYTDPHKGLSSAEVEESRKLHGSNQLTPPSRDPWWVQLLEKFTDPLIVILIVAAVISFIPVIIADHSPLESIGIIMAVLLATLVGFINEYKANKEFDILNQVSDSEPVRVVRDGKHCQVPKNELVVGDIVTLGTGEEVPADGVVLESVSLRINQASLTGESEPVLKTNEEVEEKLAGAYPRNVVLRSTLVSEGHGIICITKVGDATEIGKVAEAASEESAEKSPLNQQLDGLSKGINVLGSSIAFFLFASLIVHDTIRGNFDLSGAQWGFFAGVIVSMAIALLRVWYPIFQDLLGYMKIELPTPGLVEKEGFTPWLMCIIGGLLVFGITVVGLGSAGLIAMNDPNTWMSGTAADHMLTYFMIAITLIVVAVPEGLPMSVTLSLAYSMRKMAKQNNLVRQMDACETIGAATVVCSDKTGTLTTNRMTVRECHFPEVNEKGADAPIYPLLAEAVSVNSTADLDEKGEVLGNVTEGAMLMFIRDAGSNYEQLRSGTATVGQLPFSTMNKFMATCVKSHALEGKEIIYVKGAPEIVLGKCSSAYGEELNEAKRQEVLNTITTAQRKAMRVLGLAYREGHAESADDIKAACTDMVWMGCFVIQDPVRSDVPAAVATCLKAGVGIKIVTGDNKETACQIGREIGLLPEGDIPANAVLTGEEFGALTEEQLEAQVNDLRVLSRAKPMDKLRLVNALQKQNQVVAVTGDGTNDAPALNHADVGLSMGITGTSVAKEASDIILLDDSFASITRAIKWGRSLYRNIQKFIVFQLTVNVAACGIAAMGPFIGVDLPLTVTQMLWVNLIMDTFAALALATEPPSDDVMEQSPRNKLAFIITPDMWKWILGLGLAFIIALVTYVIHITPEGGGDPQRHDVTMLFTGFVMLQFWNLFNARVYGTNHSFVKGLFSNMSFLLIMGIILFGQILAVEFGGTIFRTESLSIQDWLILAAVTCPVLVVGEIVRFIGRLKAKA